MACFVYAGLSAADLYIKDFLNPYVLEGHSDAKPLRVYYRYRWLNTVHEDIRPYTLWSTEKQMFLPPTLEDVNSQRIIITTLSTARYISDLGLPTGELSLVFVWFVALQHTEISQGRICLPDFACCHTKIEVADQASYLTQSQYIDTAPGGPSTDPVKPDIWQNSHKCTSFLVTGITVGNWIIAFHAWGECLSHLTTKAVTGML